MRTLCGGHKLIDLGTDGEVCVVDYPDFGVNSNGVTDDDSFWDRRLRQRCWYFNCREFVFLDPCTVSSSEVAKPSRRHNDANVLALGER